MDDFLKWVLLVIAGLLVWRWWQSGMSANLNVGPGFGGNGSTPSAGGYVFQGPGMVFGINPDTWAQRGWIGNVSEY